MMQVMRSTGLTHYQDTATLSKERRIYQYFPVRANKLQQVLSF